MKQKAIFIDSTAREVREIEIEETADALKAVIGGRGLVKAEVVGTWHGRMVCCDRPTNEANFFMFVGHGDTQPIIGNALLFDFKQSVEEICDKVTFIGQDDMYALKDAHEKFMDEMKAKFHGVAKKGTAVKLTPKTVVSPVPQEVKPEIQGENFVLLNQLSDKLGEKK